ncbi:hypothetical protein [Actinoplanes sp. NPDC049802]|uniref:hypothetical protein n=1 Tax=Actinoplanes sp. NPDC049802 TaxID=3154742 RepID=UPI0034079382
MDTTRDDEQVTLTITMTAATAGWAVEALRRQALHVIDAAAGWQTRAIFADNPAVAALYEREAEVRGRAHDELRAAADALAPRGVFAPTPALTT